MQSLDAARGFRLSAIVTFSSFNRVYGYFQIVAFQNYIVTQKIETMNKIKI